MNQLGFFRAKGSFEIQSGRARCHFGVGFFLPPDFFGNLSSIVLRRILRFGTCVGSCGLQKTPADRDLVLCRRCQRGDIHALEELYQRHKDKVYALALRMTNNVQDAEDIVQEIFIQVYRKIGAFRGDAAFSSWLYRITTNVTLSALRRRKRAARELPSEDILTKDHPRAQSNKLLKPFLEKAIASLPPKSRMVFILHDVQGFQHNEIAKMLNCSVGTSKSQLHKARAQLRKSLRPRLSLISSLTGVPIGES
jgi:RNA polymerase sigma-70 factor (ECF subfamily)